MKTQPTKQRTAENIVFAALFILPLIAAILLEFSNFKF
jgi:hypothetical protein